MEESPLRLEVLMNEILLSVSMFYAGLLNDKLQEREDKNIIYMIMIIMLGVQVPIETVTTNWLASRKSLRLEIVLECVYMISRTLSFLIVSFTIELLNNYWDSGVLTVLFPIILISVGIAILKTITVSQRKKHTAINKIRSKVE